MRALFPTAETVVLTTGEEADGAGFQVRFCTVAEAEAVADLPLVVKGQTVIPRLAGVFHR